MDVQPMLTRDLVLRVCANSTEFDQGWMDAERKVVVPFTAPRDTTLVDGVVAAAANVGVTRLLMCRTRAEFAYEPVTDAPADTAGIVAVIRDWGEEPTDVLIVVEDLSAAVLIVGGTSGAEELTVAAGPDDFVRAFAGTDLPGARDAFAAQARDARESDLLRAAQRYGCLEPGGRHARTSRGPGPDTAERLAERAHALRTGAPRAAVALAAMRGAAGWAALIALTAATVALPGSSAAVPVLLGTLWLLFLIALPARSRTVSYATLVRFAVLGALTVWPLAFAEQTIVGMVPAADADWIGPTYIAVGVEEAGKFAPLLLAWPFARHRFRRFAAVDFLLLGAAAGAGLQLAEHVLAAVAAGAPPAFTDYGFFSLPPGASIAPGTGAVFAGHAVTTGLVAGAFGLALVGRRFYGAWLWALPVLAAGLAVLDHMHYNASLVGLPLDPVSGFIAAATGNGAAARWLLLLLLVVAVFMDLRLARLTADATPALPGEPPVAGLRRAARGRAVRSGVRVPGDIAPVFRRIALVWIRLPVTLACGLSSIVHEFAVALAAAGQGPAALFSAWRFLRQRRGHAMAAVRARGRAWRRHPPHERLDAVRRALEPPGRGGPAAAAGAAAVGTAAGLFAALQAAPAPAPLPTDLAYALSAMQSGLDWFGDVPASGRAWVVVAGAALLILLSTGWSVPHSPPAARTLLRRPGRGALHLLGTAAPGQVPYGAVALSGILLPKAVRGVLRPSAVRRTPG